VKPEKAEQIENMILMEAKMGRIMGQMTEAQLIQKIQEFDSAEEKTTLKISHKYKDAEDDIDLSGL